MVTESFSFFFFVAFDTPLATMDRNEKGETEHVDAISSARPSEQDATLRQPKDVNEEIIEQLETKGDDVGMTWRSSMAALVSRDAE